MLPRLGPSAASILKGFGDLLAQPPELIPIPFLLFAANHGSAIA